MSDAQNESSNAGSDAPLQVLLAEDNSVNQLVVQKLLETQGHIITLVENGQLAVDAFTANNYDVILMDMQMPVMDGVDAVRKIRRIEQETGADPIWIIALTANASQEAQKECLDAGMSAYMAKPLNFQLLLEKIEDRRGNLF
jgi:CheY-like chemotaxis protein